VKLVVVDRDGTLVDFVRDEELGVVTPAFHPAQLRLLAGVVEGLHALAHAGFAIAVATNQPDAAKGRVSIAAIERTNEALVELLASHGVAVAGLACCLHHPDGQPGGDDALIRACACRKPAPGMLRELLARAGADASTSWMLGDTPTDVQAARAAGMRAGLLFAEGRCELCPLRVGPPGAPDVWAPRFDALANAVIAASRIG
jgi:D-glycero-D-manno-heptose 1,7-bisphosphate phosphatase